MATDWKPPLKLYTVGPDFVVATTPKEAIQVVMDTTGCGLEDIGDTLAEPYKFEDLTIHMEGNFRGKPAVHPEAPGRTLPERYEATGTLEYVDGTWRPKGEVAVKATVQAWLDTLDGPTFLCSSEW